MVAITKKKRAIFLDRDGVINHAFVREGKSYPPDSLHDFSLIDGVKEACTAFKSAGYLLVVVTNQPDVATGKQRKNVVEQMHAHLKQLLPLDDIYCCFHVESDQCDCRKPKPGMLVDAAMKHDIDLGNSYMVGDRWRDVEAGQKAGCEVYFIDYNYDEQAPTGEYTTVNSLYKASQLII